MRYCPTWVVWQTSIAHSNKTCLSASPCWALFWLDFGSEEDWSRETEREKMWINLWNLTSIEPRTYESERRLSDFLENITLIVLKAHFKAASPFFRPCFLFFSPLLWSFLFAPDRAENLNLHFWFLWKQEPGNAKENVTKCKHKKRYFNWNVNEAASLETEH